MAPSLRALRRLGERYPALLALLIQLSVTLALAATIHAMAQVSTWRPSWLAAGLLHGLLAASLARWLGLSRWWWWLNLAFVPALLLASGAPLPSWLFLVGFVLLLLLNWNSFGERVPLYLTGAGSRRELASLLEQRGAHFSFVDLGCGPAGTLLWLARRFPQAQFVGVETAPLPYVIARLRCLGRRNCRIRYENLWHTELSGFDVAYCFLSPAPMARLWAKVDAELPAGAWLVSNSFDIPGVAPQRVIELDDWRASRLLVWEKSGAGG
ncbi:class I SAM-dependent methyltransferase [Phytopseudomonas dryadis]|uniref:Trans-aconitate methyltransferase n=1 Tax=Phytopseudomonas dryadis TaxID=2487520 RepID=A0ABY1Z8D5_9GAMM|nr:MULTISPECIES: class I SAM-dependent methyltransferase [Pseudomonas]TBV07555.1 trans-aconitate methyltransferase [Pseudomonas dryadis]TBV20019.1 trans-aconitate methyltransferase [Pseudomonas sp. FRB 230]